MTLSRFRVFATNHTDALAAILCAVLVAFGWLALYANWIGLALLILAAAYVIGGYDSARAGVTTLVQEQELDVDLLMIVAALGAAGLGVWRQEYFLIIDGAVLILIFAISGALEGYAMQRTDRSIRGLMSLTPDTARLLQPNGQTQEVPIAQLQVGDTILVRPGELIPTDAHISEGYSTLNQAAITGESIPVEKTIGDEVFAGTLNGNGALKLTLHQPPESSLIQRVIRLVEQAKTETPPSQQFIERFERGYARVVVIVGILLAVLPPLLGNWNWETTIYRALIFLVVASPCALMAAIMPTLLSGIANGAKQGILFKNGAQLEQIGRIKAIAFDKTGTLTTGQPDVDQVIPAPGYSECQVLQVAAKLEAYSEHPIGQAIVTAAQTQLEEQLSSPDTVLTKLDTPTTIQAFPGQGILGWLDRQPTAVGQWQFVQAYNSACPPTLQARSEQLQQAGKTVVWVAQADQILGLIAIADRVRPEATGTITHLKTLGLVPIMLTGDNQATADSVAATVGIDRVYANLLPEDKLSLIRQLQQQYGAVAMVGDGINDAPALAQASVGIAMGVAGSDVALETADIVLMSDRLERIAAAVQLGKRSQRIVKQNIVFALSFIAVLIVANFVGGINLPLGVIGHEGSTVLVTLSGLRLLR
ncbi:heavy metal translocating P-type ATPase [Thermocoleostomius sinensis]|uniref:Heavy metal translocating P-type ATPase n=1 Tax=Thermocoleostomius sinensis A174 TaxID=2016057 RepID=A0A9E8ZEW3_9CYAN|nr:heavy metal translocating P-type ATPase [Thermocoleostomius sinensis]WAL62095.1 heavy metal translocating P-type ATPase [Thermocoleostomius sinensis A174]